MKKSELRQMIREMLHEELKSEKYLRESAEALPETAYVLAAKDSVGECFLSIVQSNHDIDFKPVDSINALTPESYSCTRQEAIKYAEEAYNVTHWNWDGTVSVLAVTNFKEAYLNDIEPECIEIYTVSKSKMN
jgi:hypothetical protein